MSGSKAFGGIRVARRPVLPIDLESGDRGLPSRLDAIVVTAIPGRFEFHSDLAVMREFLNKHKGRSPLVILDTLSEVVRPKPIGPAPMLHEREPYGRSRQCAQRTRGHPC